MTIGVKKAGAGGASAICGADTVGGNVAPVITNPVTPTPTATAFSRRAVQLPGRRLRPERRCAELLAERRAGRDGHRLARHDQLAVADGQRARRPSRSRPTTATAARRRATSTCSGAPRRRHRDGRADAVHREHERSVHRRSAGRPRRGHAEPADGRARQQPDGRRLGRTVVGRLLHLHAEPRLGGFGHVHLSRDQRGGRRQRAEDGDPDKPWP